MKNVKTIYKKIEKISDKFNLIELEIDGVKIWQYSQSEVFNLILKRLNLFDSGYSVSFVQKLNYIPSLVYNSVFKSPVLSKTRSDILIFDHPRKIKFDDDYIDIYTHQFIQNMKEDQYFVIEHPYSYKHKKTKSYSKTFYTDDLKIISFFNRKFKKIKLNQKDLELIIQLEKEILSELGCHIDLIKIFTRSLVRFRTRLNYYSKLIDRKSPKIIFLVVSYSYMELIHAAKLKRIPVVEIQHGVITPYSIVYNFPTHGKNIDYFPDKIFLFGEFWKDSVNLPIKDENQIVVGFPFLELQLKKYKNIQRDEYQILFLSQGTIGKKLFQQAMEIAKELKEYKVLYKLHPSEFHDWKLRYKDEYQILPDNFEVIDSNGKSLYYYFSQSHYVVGVYSTAIYEALAFGCKCVLMDIPGIEYMEKLIELGGVSVVKNTKEFKDYVLASASKDFVDKSYFYRSDADSYAMKNLAERFIDNK